MEDVGLDAREVVREVDGNAHGFTGPHQHRVLPAQVLERLNSPPQWSATARFGKGRVVSDLGWKDTVLVWPGETVRIAIDFAHDFPGSQTYVFHCHNLEHEDGGMMINFRVQA